MTLPRVCTDDATRDLLAIADYVAPRNFAAAQRLIAPIRHAAETLPDYPISTASPERSRSSPSSTPASVTPEAPPPRATPH